MPLKYQMLLTPAVMMAILLGLVAYTLQHHQQLHEDNEIIRRWGRITDRMHVAIASAQRMQNITSRMTQAGPDQLDDLHFTYLEQNRIFSDNILYPECVEEMTEETRQFILRADQAVAHDDNLDPGRITLELQHIIPRLETVYNAFSAQKRSAYIDYYDDFQITGTRLVNISLALAIVCVVFGLILSYWTLHSVRRRLNSLLGSVLAIQNNEFHAIHAPPRNRDELDSLASGLHAMTQRLMNVGALEKVLQGAEDERKRIAMALHDQTLSDLTAVTRRLDALTKEPDSQIAGMRVDLENIEHDIRRIINDLHPRGLDLLGLLPALEAFLEQQAQAPGFPKYHCSFDAQVENSLSALEKLNLYRITQEAVRNIVKHSRANRMEVSARVYGGKLQYTIEDDGIGLHPDAPATRNGHGLLNIAERARAIGATVSWEVSRFGSGSKLTLDLPLK